jgi:hypothetical protein
MVRIIIFYTIFIVENGNCFLKIDAMFLMI